MASRTVTSSFSFRALTASATLGITVAKNIDASIPLPALTASASLATQIKMQASVSLPAIDASATLKLRHFPKQQIIYSLSEKNQKSVTTPYRMATSDAKKCAISHYSLTRPMVWQGDIAFDGPRRVPSLETTYSIRLARNYAIAFRLPIDATHAVAYVMRTAVGRSTMWGAAAQIKAAVSTSWTAAPKATATITTTWGGTPKLTAAVSAAWGALSRISATTSTAWGATVGARKQRGVAYSLRGAAVRTQRSIAVGLDDKIALRGAHSLRWALTGASAPSGQVVRVPSVQIIVGGREVAPIGTLSLLQDAKDGLWRLRVEVNAPVLRGDDVVCRIGAHTWRMVALESSIDRPDVMSRGYRLAAASAPELWDTTPIGRLPGRTAWHAGNASDIAAALAAPLTLTWSLPDAKVPAPIVHEELWHLHRWEAIKRLATAFGGWALVSKDGTTIECRASGANAGTRVPLEASWRQSHAQSAIVTNSPVLDSIEVEQTDVTDIKTAFVRLSPWRNVMIRATLPAVLEKIEETTTEHTETIALVDGVGAVANPISEVIAADVWPSSVGTLRWRQNEASVWIDSPDNATATVTYKSKALKAIVRSTTLSPTLLTVEDISWPL